MISINMTTLDFFLHLGILRPDKGKDPEDKYV